MTEFLKKNKEVLKKEEGYSPALKKDAALQFLELVCGAEESVEWVQGTTGVEESGE